MEKPSKSEVIGRCVGDEKPNDDAEPTSRLLKEYLLTKLRFNFIKKLKQFYVKINKIPTLKPIRRGTNIVTCIL